MKKDTPKGYVEGIFRYRQNKLLFDGDCAGKKIKFTYKNNEYFMCFPEFEFGKGDPKPTYANTIIQCNWAKNPHIYNIGRQLGYDRTKKLVTQFECDTIAIRSVKTYSKRQSKHLRIHIEEMKDIFINWYEIFELNYVVQSSVHHDSGPESAYFLPTNKSKKAQHIELPQDNGVITINMGSGTVTFDLVKKILRRMSKNIQIDIFYLLLISSNAFYSQQKYRESLIDSATAFEVELTQLLDKKIANLSAGQRTLIKKKVKALAGLEEALRLIDKQIFKDINIKEIITTPRNNVMHKGVQVDQITVQKALHFVKTFTFKHFPLS